MPAMIVTGLPLMYWNYMLKGVRVVPEAQHRLQGRCSLTSAKLHQHLHRGAPVAAAGADDAPALPVTLIGIAVSLYLGFKSVSAYNRWWEARTAIGTISGCSREWAMSVQRLIYKDTETVQAVVEQELLNRQLRLVYAGAYMLRPKIFTDDFCHARRIWSKPLNGNEYTRDSCALHRTSI
jgi:Bestrophin, RFP-TM, chloride channel